MGTFENQRFSGKKNHLKPPAPPPARSLVTFDVQSTLSKEDTLGTKATVRFREVSALERVQLQRYKCNSAGSGSNLLSGLESVRLERVDFIPTQTFTVLQYYSPGNSCFPAENWSRKWKLPIVKSRHTSTNLRVRDRDRTRGFPSFRLHSGSNSESRLCGRVRCGGRGLGGTGND